MHHTTFKHLTHAAVILRCNSMVCSALVLPDLSPMTRHNECEGVLHLGFRQIPPSLLYFSLLLTNLTRMGLSLLIEGGHSSLGCVGTLGLLLSSSLQKHVGSMSLLGIVTGQWP